MLPKTYALPNCAENNFGEEIKQNGHIYKCEIISRNIQEGEYLSNKKVYFDYTGFNPENIINSTFDIFIINNFNNGYEGFRFYNGALYYMDYQNNLHYIFQYSDGNYTIKNDYITFLPWGEYSYMYDLNTNNPFYSHLLIKEYSFVDKGTIFQYFIYKIGQYVEALGKWFTAIFGAIISSSLGLFIIGVFTTIVVVRVFMKILDNKKLKIKKIKRSKK